MFPLSLFKPLLHFNKFLVPSDSPCHKDQENVKFCCNLLMLNFIYCLELILIMLLCFRSDLMQQFFLTKTETLHKVHWDDTLKNNDHYDFLFNSKRNKLRLVTCTDIKVLHNKKVVEATYNVAHRF